MASAFSATVGPYSVVSMDATGSNVQSKDADWSGAMLLDAIESKGPRLINAPAVIQLIIPTDPIPRSPFPVPSSPFPIPHSPVGRCVEYFSTCHCLWGEADAEMMNCITIKRAYIHSFLDQSIAMEDELMKEDAELAHTIKISMRGDTPSSLDSAEKDELTATFMMPECLKKAYSSFPPSLPLTWERLSNLASYVEYKEMAIGAGSIRELEPPTCIEGYATGDIATCHLLFRNWQTMAVYSVDIERETGSIIRRNNPELHSWLTMYFAQRKIEFDHECANRRMMRASTNDPFDLTDVSEAIKTPSDDSDNGGVGGDGDGDGSGSEQQLNYAIPITGQWGRSSRLQ